MTATDTPTTETGNSAGSHRRGFGVDVGGSGVKGGIVDLETGELIGDRYKLPTPQPATPDAVAKTIAAVVREFGWTEPLGVTYPGVVTNGVVRTAANVDKSWIGIKAAKVFSSALDGQAVTVLNDADAAGLAEEKFGAGKDNTGVIVLLTFGTGIGSAVIHDGILLPNTEFGHLEVGGMEAEHRAASSVKEKNALELQALGAGGHQGVRGDRERDLAGFVHRRGRHQPQGGEVDPLVDVPDAGGCGGTAEHRGHRRRGDGRAGGSDQADHTAQRGLIEHCRYNGRRRPQIEDSGG